VSSSERITARVSDPDLRTALDDAADEHGSRSEAVRHAIRSTYGADVDESGGESDDVTIPDDLSATARAAYWHLREHVGTERLVELSSAKSLLANETNTPAEAVRSTIFEPLRRAGLIGVSPRVSTAFIVVHGGGN